MTIFYYISIILSFLIIIILFINDLHRLTSPNRLFLNAKKKAEEPFVSILVPAWNEESFIKRCIGSIVKSSYTNYEIIIIAGGSDRSLEASENLALLNPKIKTIEQEPGGKSAALNKGLRLAKGEIIVLVDADTVVEREWLEHLITPIIEGRAHATSGNPYPYNCNWVTSYHSMGSLLRIYRGKKSLFGAATIAVKKEVIEKIGRFDENAHAADDHALHQSVETLGYNIESVEKAIVKTDFSSTFIDFIKIETRWTRSLLRYNINKTPILKQILEPKKFIVRYFRFFNSMFFVGGISLLILPDTTVLIAIKTVYIFIYATQILRDLSKPFILFFYTKNKVWLKYFYVPVVFQISFYFYTVYGMLTYYKSKKVFEGPRKFKKSQKI